MHNVEPASLQRTSCLQRNPSDLSCRQFALRFELSEQEKLSHQAVK